MTAPLIERLRGHAESFEACYGPEEGALLREAAAEIERLEGEVRAANEAIAQSAKWAAGIAAGLAKPAQGYIGDR